MRFSLKRLTISFVAILFLSAGATATDLPQGVAASNVEASGGRRPIHHDESASDHARVVANLKRPDAEFVKVEVVATAEQTRALEDKPAARVAVTVLDPIVTVVGLVLTAIVALFAIANAVWTRASNRFANSVGMYRRFLELCVKHPEFAEPYPIDRWKDSNDEKYRQYQWFVGVLFRACEEVLDHGKDKRRWSATVMDQLRHHIEFLNQNPWLNGPGIHLYSRSLRKLIARVKEEAASG